MISFKDYLAEASVKKYKFTTPKLQDAWAILNEHCKESLELLNFPLWRGTRNHESAFVVIDPSSGERKSQNTTNVYTLLFDNSPGFSAWPKRSKSLICSMSYERADKYAVSDKHLYAIFPFDGTKIAVCPEEDIWDTGFTDFQDMSEFKKFFEGPTHRFIPNFERLSKMLDMFNDDYSSYNCSTFSQLKTILESKKFKTKFSNYILRNANEFLLITPEIEKEINELTDNLLNILLKYMSPAYVDFKLMSIAQVAKLTALGENREVWFDGKCVAIRQDMWEKFREEFNNK